MPDEKFKDSILYPWWFFFWGCILTIFQRAYAIRGSLNIYNFNHALSVAIPLTISTFVISSLAIWLKNQIGNYEIVKRDSEK